MSTPISSATYSFDFRNAEQILFSSVDQIPNWTTAHKARELLGALITEVGEWTRWASRSWPDSVQALAPRQAHQLATYHLAGIASRAAGSSISLVSCGYVPEARTSIRRLVEATLRACAVVEDDSGQHGRAWLLGQPLRKVTRLKNRYGTPGCLAGLSVSAHADLEGLSLLSEEHEAGSRLNLAPQRNSRIAGSLMILVAARIVMMNGVLMDAYGEFVPSIPTALRASELRDELDAWAHN